MKGINISVIVEEVKNYGLALTALSLSVGIQYTGTIYSTILDAYASTIENFRIKTRKKRKNYRNFYEIISN